MIIKIIGAFVMEISYPEAIRKLRAKLNVSQTELAKMLGTTLISVNRWENNKFEPTIIVKEKLKYLFNKYHIFDKNIV